MSAELDAQKSVSQRIALHYRQPTSDSPLIHGGGDTSWPAAADRGPPTASGSITVSRRWPLKETTTTTNNSTTDAAWSLRVTFLCFPPQVSPSPSLWRGPSGSSTMTTRSKRKRLPSFCCHMTEINKACCQWPRPPACSLMCF